MKLAFSTLGTPDWTFGEITATAHDLQYNGIEIRGVGAQIHAPAIAEFSAARIEKTRAHLRRLTLEIPCLTTECAIHTPAALEATLCALEGYLALAQALGAPYLRILADEPAPGPTTAADDGFIAQAAARVAEMARGRAVLLIETNGHYADSARLRALLDRVSSPALAALWDVNHPYRVNGEPPERTCENLAPYIRHVHWKDSVVGDGALRYKMPGQGDLPLRQALHALQSIGYDGYHSLEWLKRWHADLEAPGVVLAHFVHYMRAAAGA